MTGYAEVATPAGVLRRSTPGWYVTSGNEAIAEERTGSDEWTLDGRPITGQRAREILACARAAS